MHLAITVDRATPRTGPDVGRATVEPAANDGKRIAGTDDQIAVDNLLAMEIPPGHLVAIEDTGDTPAIVADLGPLQPGA